ncbi:MAG: SDR family NAD(P)-dependent oxidoreductase [Microcoleaceae cyanobacterium]
MQDKVVVIVGATGGIGAAVAQKLANSGANLVLAARDRNKLDSLTAQLSTTQTLAIPTDITNQQEVESLMEKASSHFGKIDVLVNAAGAGILKQWNKIEAADLDRVVRQQSVG